MGDYLHAGLWARLCSLIVIKLYLCQKCIKHDFQNKIRAATAVVSMSTALLFSLVNIKTDWKKQNTEKLKMTFGTETPSISADDSRHNNFVCALLFPCFTWFCIHWVTGPQGCTPPGSEHKADLCYWILKQTFLDGYTPESRVWFFGGFFFIT